MPGIAPARPDRRRLLAVLRRALAAAAGDRHPDSIGADPHHRPLGAGLRDLPRRDLRGVPARRALLGWFDYPLALALLARPLGLTRAYVPLVVALNWTSLVAAVPVTIPSLLNVLGLVGTETAGLSRPRRPRDRDPLPVRGDACRDRRAAGLLRRPRRARLRPRHPARRRDQRGRGDLRAGTPNRLFESTSTLSPGLVRDGGPSTSLPYALRQMVRARLTWMVRLRGPSR